VTSGRPFSDPEKAYIIEHAPTRQSWGRLAADLVREFPAESGGYRDGKSVRNWYRRHEHETTAKIAIVIPVDVAERLRTAGLSPVEIGALVVRGLGRV